MTKLTQIIVNLKGEARTLTQTRDSLGRFVPGAEVSPLGNAKRTLSTAGKIAGPLVVVTHHLSRDIQTVAAVNRSTGRGNAVAFLNDGTANDAVACIF